MKDIESVVSSLFDGGWTSNDEEELQREYQFTTEQAQEICVRLNQIEDTIPTEE